MRYISADHIYSAHIGFLRNGILAVDENGVIRDLLDPRAGGELPQGVQHIEGVLCPGFVNAHCHLELSHLRGQITRRTGFVGFAKELLPKRGQFSQEQIQQAIADAEEEMRRNGIVAVGDISNTADTFAAKAKSDLQYHTFVELLALHPAMAQHVLEQGKQLQAQVPGPSSLAPHAPYTVSAELLRLLGEAPPQQAPLTIHNQESLAESEFSEKGSGVMRELYDFLQIDLAFYRPAGKNSLRSVLPHLPPQRPLLLVHNTFTSAEDIQWAQAQHQNLSWCFCPKANLYIENALPSFRLFLQEGVRIVIGTDSLASNDTLSVLEELKVIAAAEASIRTEDLLAWATKNGAEALQMPELGTFEKGKRPGVICLKNLESDLRMRAAVEVVRVL